MTSTLTLSQAEAMTDQARKNLRDSVKETLRILQQADNNTALRRRGSLVVSDTFGSHVFRMTPPCEEIVGLQLLIPSDGTTEPEWHNMGCDANEIHLIAEALRDNHNAPMADSTITQAIAYFNTRITASIEARQGYLTNQTFEFYRFKSSIAASISQAG